MIKSDLIGLQGDYNQHQCGVTISDASPEDSGEWSCEMEEYNRYPKNLGNLQASD
jgi:hypothetical protein